MGIWTFLQNIFFILDKEACLWAEVSRPRGHTIQPILKWKNRKVERSDIKPLKMTENIIINSSKENDIILDCTAGSGTVEVACINQNRNYIAFEESKDLYDTANRRIAEKLESDKPKYDCEVVCSPR